MSINYVAPYTIGRFMQSTMFVRIVVGPVGSGKTTGMIMEILRRSIEQARGPDGIRRTRWAICRQTLLQLKMTVLLDILSWLRPIIDYKVSEQLITLSFGDVYSEWYMIPLEDEDDQKRLLSMQLTGAWLSEAIEVDVNLVDAIAGRCGRYPSALEGGCTWFGVIADTNAPTEGGDWWRVFEHDKPPDWQIFWQPGGLDSHAENLEWLMQTPSTLLLAPDDPVRRAQGRTYYERLARGKNENWINRYVNAQYGEDPSGTAVWRGSYKRSFHVRAQLKPVSGYPLIIGQDFGRHPCSLICQPNSKGQLLVLEEVIGEDIGLELHVVRNLKPALWHERYAGLLMAVVGDPAGVEKSSLYEEDHFDCLKRLGLPAFPAPTNHLDPRIGAVEMLLLQHRDGEGVIQIDEERCPKLIRAMGGSYRYGKTKATGETKPLPDKSHPWSDLADDLQYVSLVMNSGMVHAIARKIRPRRPQPQGARVTAAGWT